MGIPFFGRYLQTHYGSKILKTVAKGSNEYLYVDFNSLIHRCGQVVAANNVYSSEPELFDAVYECIVQYTLNIIDMIRPTKGTFLGVDGIPPLAKMYQQRKRRFMAMKEKHYLKKRDDTGVRWNPGVVTPGTTFMKGLSRVLEQRLASKSVTISDWTEEGEGEHKIFAYLQRIDAPDKKVIIYGLDADMIMLSLLHPEIQITLMREKEEVDVDDPRPRDFNFLSMESLRGAHKENDDGFMTDFVFLCMLLGNDFLPPLSHLSIKNKGIDRVVSLYQNMYDKTKRRIVSRVVKANKTTHVDFGVLRDLLQELADEEDVDMADACLKYFDARPRKGGQDMHWTNYPLSHKPPEKMITPSRPGWRTAYYHHLFKQPDVALITQQYLEGLEWNIRYYLEHKNPICQWYYEHSYSPTILDCVNFLQAHPDGVKTAWERPYEEEPSMTPDLQLLAVLPSSQEKLIAEPYNEIMHKVGLGCTHLYPTDFHVHTFLKTAVWECHPVLPNIDLHRIQRAMLSINQT